MLSPIYVLFQRSLVTFRLLQLTRSIHFSPLPCYLHAQPNPHFYIQLPYYCLANRLIMEYLVVQFSHPPHTTSRSGPKIPASTLFSPLYDTRVQQVLKPAGCYAQERAHCGHSMKIHMFLCASLLGKYLSNKSCRNVGDTINFSSSIVWLPEYCQFLQFQGRVVLLFT
jgi:hypothetical protein